MPALFVDLSAAPLPAASLFVEAKVLAADGTSPLCEVVVAGHVLSAVYDSSRRTLIPCPKSAKLSDQPEAVHALVVACYSRVQAQPEYMVLLAAENGATVLLPREGAAHGSEIRFRPRVEGGEAFGSFVILARGPDPYASLMDATRLLADKTGVQHKDVYAYVLPLLDGVNRLRFDAPLVAAKSYRKAYSAASLTSVLEQQLHGGILVQAGPGCPAKPLLQAPGLRVCQAMSAPFGVRYSGMSVVYGTATGHVLSVMDTSAALKMAPVGGMRPLGPSSSGRLSVEADSPSAVSAGVSATTSAAPSPPMSRSSSSCGDALGVDAVAPLGASPPGISQRTVPVVLSGRSITTAPIIQVLAGGPSKGAPGHTGIMASTPTGAPAHVLASFALLGVKTSGGRVGTVECCRIMPASAALSAGLRDDDAAIPASISGLGLVVQVEVSCASVCTLMLFMEGGELESCMDPSQEEGAWEDVAAAVGDPVRNVLLQGRPVSWRYNGTGGILSVELPPATGALREVQIFL